MSASAHPVSIVVYGEQPFYFCLNRVEQNENCGNINKHLPRAALSVILPQMVTKIAIPMDCPVALIAKLEKIVGV